MAQSAADQAEGNAIVAALQASIASSTVIVDGNTATPVTVQRIITSIQTLIAND